MNNEFKGMREDYINALRLSNSMYLMHEERQMLVCIAANLRQLMLQYFADNFNKIIAEG